MIRQRWFGGLLGAMLYLTGMNDQALHHLANWWLSLPEWLHVVIVVALLALAAWITTRVLGSRRRAFDAAVEASVSPGTTAPVPAE